MFLAKWSIVGGTAGYCEGRCSRNVSVSRKHYQILSLGWFYLLAGKEMLVHLIKNAERSFPESKAAWLALNIDTPFLHLDGKTRCGHELARKPCQSRTDTQPGSRGASNSCRAQALCPHPTQPSAAPKILRSTHPRSHP